MGFSPCYTTITNSPEAKYILKHIDKRVAFATGTTMEPSANFHHPNCAIDIDDANTTVAIQIHRHKSGFLLLMWLEVLERERVSARLGIGFIIIRARHCADLSRDVLVTADTQKSVCFPLHAPQFSY